VRAAVAVLAFALAACGAGSGEGLDENGRPLGSAGGGNIAPPVQGLAPTLDSIQTNVFSVNCAVSGCHSGVGAQQGLRLDLGFSYGSLVNVRSPQNPTLVRVVPFDPDASFLIQKLEGASGLLGDRMPQGGPPYLSQSTIDMIRQWIQDGALQ
jgi:hypothetical protein